MMSLFAYIHVWCIERHQSVLSIYEYICICKHIMLLQVYNVPSIRSKYYVPMELLYNYISTWFDARNISLKPVQKKKYITMVYRSIKSLWIVFVPVNIFSFAQNMFFFFILNPVLKFCDNLETNQNQLQCHHELDYIQYVSELAPTLSL